MSIRATIAALLAAALVAVLPAAAGAAPLMDWSPPHQLDQASEESPEPALDSVSCPTSTFCAATGTLGRLYTSTDPTDPDAWTEATVAEAVQEVSCAGPNWCVAMGAGPTLLYASEPGGGAGAWNSVSLPAGRSLTCPSTAFCGLLAGDNEVITSTNPLAGAGTWSGVDLKLPEWRLGPNHLYRIDCPTPSACAVSGDVGTVLASSEPTGDVDAWVKSFIGARDPFHNGAGPSVEGLDCTAAFFCAATTWGDTVATSDEPPAGTPSWGLSFTPDAFFIRAISCAEDASLCVAVDRNGYAISSRDPASVTNDWGSFEPIDGEEALTDVSCAADGGLCAAVDDEGRVIVGTPVESTEPGGNSPPAAGGPQPPLGPPSCKQPKQKAKHHGKARAKSMPSVGQAQRVSGGGKPPKGRCARPV